MSLRDPMRRHSTSCLPSATTPRIAVSDLARTTDDRPLGCRRPAAVAQGDDETKRKAFVRAFTTLQRRVEFCSRVCLLEKLDKLALKQQLDSIGKLATLFFCAGSVWLLKRSGRRCYSLPLSARESLASGLPGGRCCNRIACQYF